MRVALDARPRGPLYPGIGRYVEGLIDGLLEGCLEEVDLTVLLATDPDDLARDWEARGAALLRVAAPLRSLRDQWSLPSVASPRRFDLLHLPFFAGAYRGTVPRVVTLHDVIPIRRPETLPNFFRRSVYRAWLAHAIHHAAVLLTPTRAVQEDVQTLFAGPTPPVFVTPEAPSAAFRPIVPSQRAEIVARYDLPERFVLFVGSERLHKNIPRLIEAWARLDRSGIELVLAGKPDLATPEILATIRRLGLSDVRRLGHVPEEDLPGLFGCAEVFVLPSLDEGFGLPVIEAMACGIPVLASDRPALREVARDAALHFETEDVDDMAQKLGQLLGSTALREDLRERGFLRAGQLTWAGTARKTVDAYRRALGTDHSA